MMQCDQLNPKNMKIIHCLQVLACMAMNMIVFGLGLSIGFPTVAIPAFRGLQPEKYGDETILLSAVESSWFGMFGFILFSLHAIVIFSNIFSK